MYLIRERMFDIGKDFDITDDDGRRLYHVDGKVLTLRNRLEIKDPSGREVASVHRHLVALRPTYEITIGGEKAAEVRKQFLTPFREKFTIDVPGPDDLEISGDLFDHEFTVRQAGREVATASKRLLSIRDAYGVRIADGEDHLLILAGILALDLAMARDADKKADGA
jgi:uncharacterized protein YxjI